MKRILRSLFYAFGPHTRRVVRRLAFAPVDLYALLRYGGRSRYNGIPLPLPGEIFTGGGNFLENGLLFKSYFQRLGGLQPNESVLDIGSGLGRMAIPLTDYLEASAEYHGFDVVPSAVADCQHRITSRFPHFHFQHVSLVNDLYTLEGASADAFTFPYSEDQFDFAWATSVFTHMERTEVQNYLREARRVLKPGGRFLATFFLTDTEALASARGSAYEFKVQRGEDWYMDAEVKGANVGFTPKNIQRWAEEAGWTEARIHLGRWSGRSGQTTDFQDIVVFS
ncbi:MAG: class I SAM-dependent methyltransferase [Schleiferiaceae bacterium]|nr:class I SAM-dependent methyltransferase [Schleiferiaceae bacterium]